MHSEKCKRLFVGLYSGGSAYIRESIAYIRESIAYIREKLFIEAILRL